MGNLEKLAVLIVLFLSAVVLAVSLSDTEPVPEGSPFETAGAAQHEPQGETGTRVVVNTPKATRTEPSTAPAPERPAGLPAMLDADASGGVLSGLVPSGGASAERGILTSTRGLRPSFIDAYMEYTVEEGDSWAALARRFYADERYLSSLKIANDDLAELRAGTKILVPVHDLAAEAESRDRLEPVENRAVPEALERPARTITAGETYTVVSGDNLSTIAFKVYGSGARWAEIFEANRDKLESPDWLSVGMELFIPTESEFVGAVPTPTRTEPTDSTGSTGPARRSAPAGDRPRVR